MRSAPRITENGVTLLRLDTNPRGAAQPEPSGGAIPRLHPGDRLKVVEFLRRYSAMPEVKKAELIEGVVYMPSPVSRDHGDPDVMMITWLGTYRAHTPGTEGLANTTVVLDLGENCSQPDSCLRIVPEYGGQSRNTSENYVGGAPELNAEVSASSAGYDLHDKLRAYERNGVQEYVVWCVEDRSIDWFILRDGRFRKMAHRGGVFKSKVFPGLWLDAVAMLNGDLAKVLKVLQKGLKSDEHRRFVARLAKRKQTGEQPQ